MKIYECGICGNKYNEEKTGKSFGELEDGWECPVCGAPKSAFSCPDDGETAAVDMKPGGVAGTYLVYECGICGNKYSEESSGKSFGDLEDGWECPVCGAPKKVFSCPDPPAGYEEKQKTSSGVSKRIYECGVCGNTYNEEKEGKAFGELPEGWQCSICGANKNAFSCPDAGEGEAGGRGVQDGPVKIYQCSVCGHLYDERKQDCSFIKLDAEWQCPVCGAPKYAFHTAEDRKNTVENSVRMGESGPLAYPEDFARSADDMESKMSLIHHMAVTGESLIEPMRTKLPVISWDDIMIMGAQLAPIPLDEDAEVDTKTVIGKNAIKPMTIDMPVYISHMSFGALSREVKIALAMGSDDAGTAMCSGEGGILPEEFEAAGKYIFEYVPNMYSVTDENLKKADAIEIKIGQGTKPGMGGHLPGDKVTEEIAAVRKKPVGKDIISPSRFPGVNSKEDLKKLVDDIRKRSEGRPVGIKIAAGHIEKDLEVVIYAKPDFVTIDGRGGATGASPRYLKDASSVPTIYALYRARKYLDDNNVDIGLVITGGLRTSSDFVKALSMGADAVAIASAALMAAACQQYRVCHTGKCPTGVMTQDPELRKNIKIEAAARRVSNFLKVTHRELETFCRISGHGSIKDLSVEDLCTVNSEISDHTNIPHV